MSDISLEFTKCTCVESENPAAEYYDRRTSAAYRFKQRVMEMERNIAIHLDHDHIEAATIDGTTYRQGETPPPALQLTPDGAAVLEAGADQMMRLWWAQRNSDFRAEMASVPPTRGTTHPGTDAVTTWLHVVRAEFEFMTERMRKDLAKRHGIISDQPRMGKFTPNPNLVVVELMGKAWIRIEVRGERAGRVQAIVQAGVGSHLLPEINVTSITSRPDASVRILGSVLTLVDEMAALASKKSSVAAAE